MALRFGSEATLLRTAPQRNSALTSSEPSGSGLARTPPIECRNLWKIFGERAEEALRIIKQEGLGKTEVLERLNCVVGVADASFSVGEGEIFCVMGLSGSGKSTLVRHINRLIEPTDGLVLFKGENIGAFDMDHLRELRSHDIGMVFQHMALLPHRNVRDNVAFALELRKVDRKTRMEVADKALQTVELAGWENHYPDELSGGMKQRVGLARALAADPEVLLMDEPFSALDPLIRRQLQDQFLHLSKKVKKTTVFITHDLDEAIRLGDHIAIMKDGRLVQIGTPEDIVTNPKDDYVADFVAGISRLKLVYAHTVMQSFDAYRANGGEDLEGAPTASPGVDLDHLVNLACDTDKPILIVEDGKAIGVVTKRALLRGIQGRGERV